MIDLIRLKLSKFKTAANNLNPVSYNFYPSTRNDPKIYFRTGFESDKGLKT